MNRELQIRDVSLMKTICAQCNEDFTCHSFNFVGHTLEGGAIFYTKITNASNYDDTKGITEHCKNYLNYMNPVKWSWIIDFEGFSLKHTLGVNTGIQLAKLINTYGKLHQLIMINTNLFVDQMLTMIKFVLDKKYHQCIQTIHSRVNLLHKFQEWLPINEQSLHSLHLLV